MIRLLVTTQKDLLWGALVPYLSSQSLRYQFSSANHSLKTFSETTQNYKTGDKFHATLSSVMNFMSPFYIDSLCPGNQPCGYHSARVIAMQSDQLSLNHCLRVANQNAEHRLKFSSISRLASHRCSGSEHEPAIQTVLLQVHDSADRILAAEK